jgi:hypothetical protein
VADSVPVPLSGNDLKAYLIINPSSMCCVSQLCSPSLTWDVRLALLFLPEMVDLLLLTRSQSGPTTLFVSVHFPLSVFPGALASHGKLVL